MSKAGWMVFVCGLAIGLAPFFLALAGSDPPPKGISTTGRVVNVVDGDTLDVVIDAPRVRIRLLDCWAPESRTRDLEEKARGLAAKVRLQELIGDQSVVIFIPTADTLAKSLTLGRVLGRVWLDIDGDGKLDDVSAVMVAEGHATADKHGKPQ